jgi:hypothetical protein
VTDIAALPVGDDGLVSLAYGYCTQEYDPDAWLASTGRG